MKNNIKRNKKVDTIEIWEGKNSNKTEWYKDIRKKNKSRYSLVHHDTPREEHMNRDLAHEMQYQEK